MKPSPKGQRTSLVSRQTTPGAPFKFTLIGTSEREGFILAIGLFKYINPMDVASTFFI